MKCRAKSSKILYKSAIARPLEMKIGSDQSRKDGDAVLLSLFMISTGICHIAH